MRERQRGDRKRVACGDSPPASIQMPSTAACSTPQMASAP